MSAKVYPLDRVRQMKDEGYSLAAYMTVISWILLGVGVVMCLMNISDFTDRNMTLMAGLGFMISSVFVYTVGTSIYLVQSNADKGNG
ncbi:putative membrane channel-forming protein YqfA (hemolysin III family) [Paenibacillus shirakamiensis]|uniref:Membrane channel-forming protein YqfA (Hemolysin III family) n=1 Tax=Paenibacillus shirakamiensis TaxID=1265935 RepID=A0ABS4JG80_9BACL|nr:hypothetical protein [Paenibacillus shirakamiensis]MBP2000730.1 putative membrane channel-forming protein YqfA (hemolysin III family) [Paenibacillus shirakamiensis]